MPIILLGILHQIILFDLEERSYSFLVDEVITVMSNLDQNL